MPRLQLLDVAVYRARTRNVVQREIVVQGFEIDLRPRHQLQESLDLRAEDQPSPIPSIEQRLDSESIPGEKQALRPLVPEGKGEHPIERTNTGLASIFIEMDDRLGVALRRKSVSSRLELGSKLAVVVDLAIENYPDRVVLIRERLGTRYQVDDTESPVTEPDAPAPFWGFRTVRVAGDHRPTPATLEVDALAVRTAVAKDLTHSCQHLEADLGGSLISEPVTADATHGGPFRPDLKSGPAAAPWSRPRRRQSEHSSPRAPARVRACRDR